MHEAFDVEVAQLNEYAEIGHGGDHPLELLADAILEKFALEPGIDLTRCVVRATLGHGTLLAQGHHRGGVVGIDALSLEHNSAFDPIDVRVLTSTSDRRANRAVHQ